MTTDPTLFWEDRYSHSSQLFSGNPNPLLVREVTGLPPGNALDLGCGEGGDAIWLAGQGWRVTGVDISMTALRRAADHAERAGVGGLVAWERHELGKTFPGGRYELVSAQFLQSPVALDQDGVLRRAVEAVAPGGTLLMVMHGGWPSWMTDGPEFEFPTLDGVLAALAVPDWTVVTVEAVEQDSVSPEGVAGTRVDLVWRLRNTA
ncbi:class I SAM-dependent methyltransferase [Actinokineospora sp. G85]|uniref:class I SAM-dependent methyltransferase n=1 Tax=Actinokineospora sp. G85 TaxID=3406626 RepID=UPI003C72E911